MSEGQCIIILSPIKRAAGILQVKQRPEHGQRRLEIGARTVRAASCRRGLRRSCLQCSRGRGGLAQRRVTNSIGGVVRDSAGKPLPGADIFFLGHDFGDSTHRERARERFGFVRSIRVTQTDGDGRWSVSFVPPAHPGFSIEARHSNMRIRLSFRTTVRAVSMTSRMARSVSFGAGVWSAPCKRQ
jgi:hypothetical protein